MKNNFLTKLSAFAILFAFAAIMVVSCKKDDPEVIDSQPALPPASSMTMDCGNFWDGDPSKSGDTSKSNLVFAGTNIIVWNVILTVGLAVPVASFAEAFKHNPVWDKTAKEWIWSYAVPVGLDTYTCSLHGKTAANDIQWSMYISKNGGFSNFLWYTGTSKKDNSSGQWILNNNPTSPNPLLQIDWKKSSLGVADIKYMNVVPGGAENGGYIQYGIVSDTTYNAFYDIYNKGKNNYTNIKWNRTSYAGRVKDSLHFGDTNWHCWNTILQNDTCQ